jgi:hypothetical protein
MSCSLSAPTLRVVDIEIASCVAPNRAIEMTLTDLANIGEAVGGIAVVITLIYLAVQIRQNTRMMRAAAHHSANQLAVEINLALGTDPRVSEVLLLGSKDLSGLDPTQSLMFHLLMRSIFSGAEDFYIQTREGLLNADMWESRKHSMHQYLLRPGIDAWWTENQSLFSNDFVDELNRR